MERRFIKAESIKLETRAGNDQPTLAGYAAVFNVRSSNLGGFVEIIAPRAFDDALVDDYVHGDEDVRSLFNHNPDYLLARSNNDTLRLKQDKTGLFSESDLIDTSAGRDAAANVRTGRITQMSFAFTTLEDKWEIKDGLNVRTLLKAARLYDVSPVTYPAYPQTTIGMRSINGTPAELDMDKIMSVVVRLERGLSTTKEDVVMIKEARAYWDGLIAKVDSAANVPTGTGRSLADLAKKIAELTA